MVNNVRSVSMCLLVVLFTLYEIKIEKYNRSGSRIVKEVVNKIERPWSFNNGTLKTHGLLKTPVKENIMRKPVCDKNN